MGWSGIIRLIPFRGKLGQPSCLWRVFLLQRGLMRRSWILLLMLRSLRFHRLSFMWLHRWPFRGGPFQLIWRLFVRPFNRELVGVHQCGLIILCLFIQDRLILIWGQRGQHHKHLRRPCCQHRLPFSQLNICLPNHRVFRRFFQVVHLFAFGWRLCSRGSYPTCFGRFFPRQKGL